MKRLTAILIALILSLAAAGCGEKDESEDGSTTATGAATETGTTQSTTTESEVEVEETADAPAELPEGWSEEINEAAGFSIGVPPSWTIRDSEGGQGSIITSPDQLIVVTVTADRTQGALQLPLEEFATRTAEAFGGEALGEEGFTDLKVTRAVPFKDTYDAVAVRAIGTSKQSGERERLFVVVVRREGQAAYVVVSRENAEQESSLASRDDVKEIIRSLRGRPPT